MKQVTVAHRETRNLSDKVALIAVKLLRWGLDTVSGYKHDKAKALHALDPKEAQRKYGMTGKQYLVRNVFLESVAGVPGMVAGMLRHLHSMRRLKRDHGWIETLLEESYNERMHLLIFLKVRLPSSAILTTTNVTDVRTWMVYADCSPRRPRRLLQRHVHLLPYLAAYLSSLRRIP